MKIQKTVHLIHRRYFLIDQNIQQIHFKVSGWLNPVLIPIQSIEENSRLVEKLKKSITKSQVDSIDSWLPFDWSKKNIWSIKKEHLIDQRWFLIDQTCEIEFFQIFLVTIFWCFTWTKHSFLITSEWDWDQNWISLIL